MKQKKKLRNFTFESNKTLIGNTNSQTLSPK